MLIIGGSKIKVTIITNYPPIQGRLSEYALNLIDELQKCPNVSHIDIITEKISGQDKVTLLNDKVTLHRIWRSNNPLTFFLVLRKIMSINADIVHFNIHMAVFGQSRISNFFGLSLPFICRIIGFKTVTTLHNLVDKIDLEKTGYKDNFINRLSAFLITKLIASSSAVTLTMKSHTDYFKEKYRCKNARYIPHGTWKNNSPNQRQVCKNESILYIGHSGPYKDIDLLLNAFKILEKKNRRLKLIFAGAAHPNYPKFLDKYKKTNSYENILFTGYVPEDQLQALFEKANAVILPYRICTGTSGIAHLASSYGTPIVATDLPEFRELAKEGCGLLISAHRPQALADKIEEIIDNPKLALELKERNINFANSRSWNIVASNFCSLYEELLV
ncbi:MAG: glycosyltransferase [Actinobacteria bacterium]|nr:glycosyltransferase [Actinomycetota bacterium]